MADYKDLKFAGRYIGADFGVRFERTPWFKTPTRRVGSDEVPGMSGNFITDFHSFENLSITYKCWIAGKDAMEKTSAFMAWINARAGGYYEMHDEHDPGHYRLGRLASGIEPVFSVANKVAQFDLTFDCKPQRFLQMEIDWSNVSGTIVNDGGYPSYPLFKITGTGVITITSEEGKDDTSADAQGASIYVNANPGVTMLDCETMQAFSEDGSTLYNNNVRLPADRVYLAPGNNRVICSGVSAKIKCLFYDI